jgi:ferredoxin--NADP+ reductase
MVGIHVDGKPLVRAYSVASVNHEDSLEFFSIKVPHGPLTSRLQHLKEGDEVLIGRKATGTLVIDNLLPGKHLYLLATGTGLAPFLSIIRDPETYERFEKIVLIHGCRTVAELAYRELINEELPADEVIGELVAKQLIYVPTVTREHFENKGRLTDLFGTPALSEKIGLPPPTIEDDRIMLCGSPQMITSFRTILNERGYDEGNHGTPGHYVVERAFAER